MFFSVYTLGCKLNQLETEAVSDSFRKEGFTIVPFSQIEQIEQDGRQAKEPGIILINTCTVTSMAEQKARRVIRKTLKERRNACVIVTGCYAQLEKAELDALEDTPDSWRGLHTPPLCGGHKVCNPSPIPYENNMPRRIADSRSAAGHVDSPRRLFVIPGEKKDRLLDMGRYITGVAGFACEAGKGGVASGACVGDLSRLVASWLDGSTGEIASDFALEPDGTFRFAPEGFSSHSRSFLKIQDGCDNSCAYCRVRLARGKSRSLAANEVLKRLTALEERGYSEAVLTGVNISQYRDSAIGLPGLLEFLLSETAAIRLRLSSIEPDMITDELLRVLENKRVRPHFHLSLQSGSAEILARMGRHYTPEDVRRKTASLRMARNDPFLACDIIAAFPGETEDEFMKTFALCEETNFAWIHAFPFSPRPGTAAFGFSGRVGEKEKTGRVERLNALAVKGRLEYIRRWEGKEVEAVVEKGDDLEEGLAAGVSENYLKIRVNYGDGPRPSPGSLIRCRIKGIPANSGFDAAAES